MITRPVFSSASYASNSSSVSSSIRTNVTARSAADFGARFCVMSMRNSNDCVASGPNRATSSFSRFTVTPAVKRSTGPRSWRTRQRAGIARRRVVRKMTDESVAEAAARYERGASLAKVAGAVGVHERTITREFRRAGVSIRPRRNWRP